MLPSRSPRFSSRSFARSFRFFPLVCLVFAAGCIFGPNASLNRARQADYDLERVAGVHHIAALVEAYHAETGDYPLARDGYPLPVEVPVSDVESYLRPNSVPPELFVRELQRVLGDDIIVPNDPQGRDPYGARLYQYIYDGSDYTVSTYLFDPTPFTRPVDDYMHAYAVGSMEDLDRKVYHYRKMIDGEYGGG